MTERAEGFWWVKVPRLDGVEPPPRFPWLTEKGKARLGELDGQG